MRPSSINESVAAFIAFDFLRDGFNLQGMRPRAFELRLEMFPCRVEVIHFVLDKEYDRFCHAPLIQQMGRL